MSLSIQIPDNLEQQLTTYCQQHQLSINETIRLALERLLIPTNKPLSPYELGKQGFGADETHEGDIAQQSKDFLTRYPFREQKVGYDESLQSVTLNSWEQWFASLSQFSDDFMVNGREQPPLQERDWSGFE